MKLTLVSYGGSAINDGTIYHAKLLNPEGHESEALILERQNYLPVYGGKRHKGKTFHIAIDLNAAGSADPSGTIVGARMGTIGQWFSPYQEVMGTLLATDAANANKQWYVMVTPYNQPSWTGRQTEILLMAADPVWRSVVQGTATYSGTAATGTITCTVGGNQNAYPIITYRPTGAQTGNYAWKRFVLSYNRTDEEIRGEAWNLTDNGSGTATWNTAAAVSGGTIQADGDDVTVYCDGVELPRWLGNVGGATRIFSAIPYSPRVEFTIQAITTTAAITTITAQPTNANLAAFRRLPDTGMIWIENEGFSYTAKKCPNKKSLQLTIGTRAIRGTTAATHAAATTARWIEHDIWILYGNASATAPEGNDTEQPLFTVTTSDNVTRVFTAFSDNTGKRTGQWQHGAQKSTGVQSDIYLADQNGDTVDPSTTMGMAVRAWQRGTRWQSENAVIEWRYHTPVGITQVIASGQKYRVTTSWPATIALQKAHLASKWSGAVWNQGTATPGTAGVWTGWNAGTASLGGTFEYVRFYLAGAIAGLANNAAYFEVDDVTLTYAAANTPYISMGSPVSNYLLDCSLTNQTTGETLYTTYTMAVNTNLTVNTDARTVAYSDNTNALAARRLDAVRTDWLRLVPGTNTLVFSATGWTGGTVTVNWEDRATV